MELYNDVMNAGYASSFFNQSKETPDKDVLVCMEICKGLRYNPDVGNKQDILICKEETVP